MIVKDRIIVLKTTKYGESDLIVNGLTRTGAKKSFFARSALRSKKRFGGGVLEPTHYIEVLFKEKSSLGGEGKLHTLQEAHLLEGFEGLRKDYDKLQMALYFVKTIASFSKEDDLHSPDIFNLLGNALKILPTEVELSRLKTHFELKLLASQGVLEERAEWGGLDQLPLIQREEFEMSPEHWRSIQRAVDRLLRTHYSDLLGVEN